MKLPLAGLAVLLVFQEADSSATGNTQWTVDGHVIRDAVQLQAAINASIASGERGYSVQPGAYYFEDGAPLVLFQAKGWSLKPADGRSGSVQLWFQVSQKWRTGGVLIKECSDITVEGFTVDYDPPTHYQGTVTASTAVAVAPVGRATALPPVTPPKAACYRRMETDLAKCVAAEGIAVRMFNRTSRNWKVVANTNCYPGAGASIPPGPEPFPCCVSKDGAKDPEPITLEACEDSCTSDPVCTAIVTGVFAPPPPPSPPSQMKKFFVTTDQGFPEPHAYIADHSTAADPSDNYINAPAIWPKHIGFGCNRTLGCPGHGAGVLQPINTSLPNNVNVFQLLPSARLGDKITISIRKGITWHIENSTRVTTSNVAIHSASLFGLSEFDGGGGHAYRDVWLGRRRGVNTTQLCGRAPGRACFGILASNADAFHSSGCRVGPTLRNVTLSNNFDDFMNVHSRMQLLGDFVGEDRTELIILDPRLEVAEGVPNDTPYGAAETMPNARAGDTLEFHALNTFTPHGVATIASLERVSDPATVAKYGAAAVQATSGAPPYSMTPPMNGNVAPDVGQICGAFAAKHGLPKCRSRVWRVRFPAPVPPAATLYDIVSLRGWDNAGLEVRDSHFFGGIDGVHSKSNGAVFANNTLACTGFDVSPWQHYLEGPPHLFGMQIVNNTFTACGGRYGSYVVNCSGIGKLPTYPGGDGFCNGVGGKGVMVPGTCDMQSMRLGGNHPPTDCTVFDDPGAQRTCCSACGQRCRGC